MNIGPYSELVILGGGRLARELANWALSNNFPVSIITSPRHADDSTFFDETFESFFKKKNIKTLVTEKLNASEVKSFLGDTKNKFCLSMGAAWIFKPEFIKEVFQAQLFNLHGTRLPQNRGGGGFSWQILTGNRFGFSLIHAIDGGVDTGDILFCEEFLYPSSCRIPQDFSDFYLDKNFKFVINKLMELKNNSIFVKPVSQPEYFSTYWPRLNTDTQGWIDWNWDASYIERFVCAFDDPYDGAQTFLNDEVVRLKKVSINFQDGHFHPYQTGMIYRKSTNWICVAAVGAGLIIENIENAQKKNIFSKIQVGDRLYTPPNILMDSKHRVKYDAKGLVVRS